jgi:HAMP domain-containing protein
MTLTRKLVLSFLAVALVPLAGVIAVFGAAFLRQAEQQVGARLEDNVAQAGRSIDQFMLNCLRDMQAIAATPSLRAGVPAQAAERLKTFGYAYPYFDHLHLADLQGRIVVSSSVLHAGRSLFELLPHLRDDFAAVLGRPAAFVQVSDLSDAPAATLAAAAQGTLTNTDLRIAMRLRVEDARSQPVGVLVGDIVTRQLRELLEAIDHRTPGDEHVYLLDPQGRALAATDPRAQLLQPHPDFAAAAWRTRLAQGSDGFAIYQGRSGRKLMAGYATLWQYGANNAGNWRLVSVAPHDFIMAPVRQVLQRTLAVLTVVLLVVAGAGFWLARALSRPVLALTRGTRALGAGDSSARVPVAGEDEVGQLARAFNRMAEFIQRNETALQTEIAERRHAEQEIRTSEERFRQLAENINEIFFRGRTGPAPHRVPQPGVRRNLGRALPDGL